MIPWLTLVLMMVSNLALVPPTVLPKSPLYPSPHTREVPLPQGGWWGSFGDSIPADSTTVIDSTEVAKGDSLR